MAAADNVVQLFPESEMRSSSESTTHGRTEEAFSIENVTNVSRVKKDSSDFETEAFFPKGDSPTLLSSALRLIDDSMNLINDAKGQLEGGSEILADDLVVHFQRLLPELFCCRDLGDGFGIVVVSMFHGMNNENGMPLDRVKIQVLYATLYLLRREPYMNVDRAVELVGLMEDKGFRIEPSELAVLAEALDV